MSELTHAGGKGESYCDVREPPKSHPICDPLLLQIDNLKARNVALRTDLERTRCDLELAIRRIDSLTLAVSQLMEQSPTVKPSEGNELG